MTQKPKHGYLLPFLATLALCFAPGDGEATTLVPLDMDDLVIEADNIVLGTVVAKHSEWHANYVQQRSLLYTVYALATEDVLKGQAGGSIEFRVVGGEDGTTTLTVPGAPRFEVGERVVVFLRDPIPDAVTDIVGLEQGKFTVVDETVAENGMELDDFISLISKTLHAARD
jgi:hypothetical protein